MPIEINELHIKVNVNPDERKDAGGNPKNKKQNKEDIIQICVEQVLEILERKKQR